MRKLNTLYTLDGESERIIATRTGKAIPLVEPVFILRGRDHLGYTLLKIYYEMLLADRAPGYMTNEVKRAFKEFDAFATKFPDEMTLSGLQHAVHSLKRKYERRLNGALSEVALRKQAEREEKEQTKEVEGMKPLVPLEDIDPDSEGPLIDAFQESDLPDAEDLLDLDTDEPLDLDS